jgi:hypothetical protein
MDEFCFGAASIVKVVIPVQKAQELYEGLVHLEPIFRL